MKTDKLRFGVSYCPFAKSGDTDMKYWERDFKTMKKLNFNTLRCFVAWDRIEREEGKLDFSKTDYIFELAEKYDMEVILNIGGVFDCHGGIYPPRWLIYDYNCQHIIEDPTRPYAPFGSFRLLCPDDRIFAAKAAEFTINAIERYKDRRELCGWNVWNEAALDHMCYCPATMLKFRTWLKTRYNEDLDRLNREWGTEFPLDFRTWDMVEPGLGAGFRAGGHMARLDWMHFNRDKVEGWVKGVNRLVKDKDSSGRPTTSNVVVHGAAATDGRGLNSPDLWGQNHDLDIAGFSFYSEKAIPSDCSYMLSSVRGSSAATDKSFWILETCAGQMFNPQIYPGDCCDKDFRIATHWLSVLHGCKTILLWKFGGRVTDNQTDFFNLTGWDGGVTERAENNAVFAANFLANEQLLLDKSYLADTAILFSQDSYIFNIVDNSLDSYEKAMKSRLGAYQMLRDLRIQIDVISDTRIHEGCLSKYRVLIIPWCEIMSRELADRIGEFVKNGGTVIADRMLNIKDEDSHIHFQAPGHGLSEVFGAYINDMLLTAVDERIHTAFGDIPLCCHRHAMIHPAEDAEVIGVYKNGTPALVTRNCGKGKTLWFGSDVFFDYRGKPCAASAAIIEKTLAEAGVTSEFSVKGDTTGMEFGVMTGIDGEKLYFILNMSSGEREFSLSLSPSGHRFHDMLSPFSCCGETHVRMLPWEVKILS